MHERRRTFSERLTALVLTPERDPTLVVPALERPDAAAELRTVH